MKRNAKRIRRELTPAEQERLRRARREAQEDRPQIERMARSAKAEHDAALSEIRGAIESLRTERNAQGLSLAAVEDRTGFSRSALCRLENDLDANPTVSTLIRYARALGKRLVISLED
jgi:hypothetical protein